MTQKTQPDDVELKAEIESIAGRIDHILKTVQQYYPICDQPSEKENRRDPSDPENRQSHHQSPEQEA